MLDLVRCEFCILFANSQSWQNSVWVLYLLAQAWNRLSLLIQSDASQLHTDSAWSGTC